jgi:hypothetical protein
MGFADNYTLRVRTTYVAAGVQHKFKVRGSDVDTFAAVNPIATAVGDFFDSIAPRLYTDFAFLGWEYALPDSDIWVPFEPTSVATPEGAINVEGRSGKDKIQGYTLSGRGVGAKARLYFFGMFLQTEGTGSVGANGIINIGELSGLDNCVTIANASFHAANGSAAIWYPRLTMKTNDALEPNIRRGLIA